jgi:formylglycine-generating enzyme required for sulfatase activity
MNNRFLKGAMIGVGALVLSTVGIFASDMIQGIDTHMNNMAGVAGGVCPQGMTRYNGSEGNLCVDTYEVSASTQCPHISPKNVLESEKNTNTKGCYGASVEKGDPWTYVTLQQAQRLCAEAGKRLPTSNEWYQVALGTDADACILLGSNPSKTGTDGCVSSVGAHDMIGNVWEWVNETVTGNTYNNRTLPNEGYVVEADASGIAIHTDPSAPNELYGKDYVWTKSDGVFGMIRGGFYGSGDDGGLFTINASVPTNFATQGVGFRCVMSL